jgi:hypothetical protein
MAACSAEQAAAGMTCVIGAMAGIVSGLAPAEPQCPIATCSGEQAGAAGRAFRGAGLAARRLVALRGVAAGLAGAMVIPGIAMS